MLIALDELILGQIGAENRTQNTIKKKYAKIKLKERLGDQIETKNEKYLTNKTLAIIDEFKTIKITS